ncbi:MAG TPA: glycoside hydrolase family 27 protein [Niabella sp.]|nr:glycoside hydrolase family 27 protein [Niabella sp.]
MNLRFSILFFSLVIYVHEVYAQEIAASNVKTPFGVTTQRINNTPKKVIAQSPPMGWNSWNNFGLDITESEFKQQVDYVAKHLKKYGYEYMVIDAGWYAPSLSADRFDTAAHHTKIKYNTLTDEYGRWLPAPNRFPSAKNGSFKELADYVHSKGLKFGLHIQRGIPWSAVEKDTEIKGSDYRAKDIANPADACSWWDGTTGVDMSVPGSQEYYNSCVQLYADWGVDFLKVDDISRPYHADEVTAFRIAIEKTGRDIILSLSPGTTSFTARHHAINNSDMYRISNDFWDRWSQLKAQFALANSWLKYQKTGHYADLDMLPVGVIGSRSSDGGQGKRKTGLTETEQYTMLSLWAIFRSPLILGNDLLEMDEFTTKLITNEGMLEVNQQGDDVKRVIGTPPGIHIYYSVHKSKKEKFVAIFNTGESEQKINVDFSKLGLSGVKMVKDLWNNKTIDSAPTGFSRTVPPHGSGLFRVSY